MKKITLTYFAVLAFVFFWQGNAQLFTIETCNGTIGTTDYGPMHSVTTANAASRTAVIYPSSQLVGITGQDLSAVFFNRIASSGSMAGIPNFKVYLKETADTDFGSGDLDWPTETASATLVYDSDPTTSVGSTAGWKNFSFSTNFVYSGTQNLAVFLEYVNETALTTAITWEYEYSSPCVYTSNSNTTKYSNNTTGTPGDLLGSSNYRRPFIGFDFVVSCPAPTALSVDNITTTTADISWMIGDSEVEWDYSVQLAGTGMPSTFDNTVSNSFTEGTLSPDTDYEIYVRAVCGVGDESIWIGPFEFTTPCAAIVPDYTTDFDLNVPDSCWMEADAGEVVDGPSNFGSASWYASSYSDGVNTIQSNIINLYFNNKRDWLISPSFDLSSGGPFQLDVHVRHGGNAAVTVEEPFGSDDEVQLLMSTDNGATWTNITTWDITNDPGITGQDYTEDLSAQTGTVKFAMFGSDGTVDDSEDHYFHISKFVVRTTPACLEPSNLTVSTITSSSADLGWGENGTSSNWDIEWGVDGFTPTGTPNVNDTGDNPHNLTGLSSATSYDFYVRSDCGMDDTDVSIWVGPLSFVTLCESVINFPYIEDFEDDLVCWDTDLITGTTNWVRDPDSGSGDISGPHTGDGFMEKNYSSSDAILISPSFNLTALGEDARVNVWLHRHADADADDLYTIYINTTSSLTGATQVLQLYSKANIAPTVPSTGWYQYFINIPSTFNASDSVYVLFQGTTNAGFSSYDLGIDDFIVEAMPSCISPTDLSASAITAVSVNLGWTENGSSGNWDIEWGADGFTPTGTPNVNDTGDNPYNLTGLTAQTSYDFYVRSDCGMDDTTDVSTWEGPYNFVTACDPFGDFTEGFETTATSSVMPECWDKNIISTSSSYVYVSTSDFNTGSNALRMGNSGDSSAELYAVTPALTDLPNQTHQLRFFAKKGGTGTTLEVGTITDPTDENTFTSISTIPVTTAHQQYIVTFDAPTTDSYIAFKANYTSTYYFVSIDDVIWEAIPSCPAPSSLYTDGIAFTSANLGWTENGSSSNWDIEWGIAGFTPTGIPNVNDTVDNPYNLTGLTAQTSYDFYVRTDCGMDDTTDVSTWEGPFSFYTGYCIPSGTSALTYIDNFSTTLGDTNIANNASGFSIDNYGNFAGLSVSLASNDSFDFNVEIVSGTVGCAIWVDWNKDLVLDVSEVQFSTTAYGNGPFTGTITVPDATPDGEYRMRVLIDYNDNNPGDDAPCSFGSGRGEVEDYSVMVDNTLSTIDFDGKSLFTYYPNPVNNILTLNAQKAISNISVLNMLGQEVISTTPHNMSNEVDMSDLKSGAYFVRVTIGNSIETIKIIKN